MLFFNKKESARYTAVERLYTGCIKKNGVHVLCLIISKLLKLIEQFWTCFKLRFFSFEQAVIGIFTPRNVRAMANLVKAIDLRCPPIMQINSLCLSWSPVKFLIFSLIT